MPDVKTQPPPRTGGERSVETRSIATRAAPKVVPRISRRERFVKGLKTFLWVAPLTVLIWVYAEREQAKEESVRVPIRLRSTASDRVVTLISPADGYINIDLKGPRKNVYDVSQRLVGGKEPLEIAVSEDIDFDDVLPVAERLDRLDLLRRNALSVSRVHTPVRVKVEAKASRSAAVRQKPETKIVGTVKFDPPSVMVEGPRGFLNELPAEGMVVLADMSQFAGRKEGLYENEIVPISFPTRSDGLSWPKTVKATVQIQVAQTETLQSVVVGPWVPARTLEEGRYTIKFDRATLTQVVVTGTPEAIALVKEKPGLVKAIIEITPADLKPGGSQKTVTLTPADYRVPPGITVLSTDKEVTITITENP